MYLELLPEISCDRWSHLPFDQFIEQMIRLGIADYDERGMGSAISGRVRAVGNSAGGNAPQTGQASSLSKYPAGGAKV